MIELRPDLRGGVGELSQWNVDNGMWTMECGQWNGTMECGQWNADNGMRTMECGQWNVDNGMRTME